jgi:hypothetical protein
MRKWPLGFVILCLFLMSACSVTRSTRGNLAPGVQIEKEGKVFIMAIADPFEKHENPAHGSGTAVEVAIRDSLMSHGFKPFISKIADLQEGITEAGKLAYQCILRAVVTEWEDNATPWSGKPDTYELSVEIYGVENKELLGAATHRVAGPEWAMFERHPDRFIPEAVDHVLAKIFRWQPSVFATE